jgi:hypothetical protein
MGRRHSVAPAGPKRVVRKLVQQWPRTPKALERAGRWVEDLTGADRELHSYLVSVCLEAAAPVLADSFIPEGDQVGKRVRRRACSRDEGRGKSDA